MWRGLLNTVKFNGLRINGWKVVKMSSDSPIPVILMKNWQFFWVEEKSSGFFDPIYLDNATKPFMS